MSLYQRFHERFGTAGVVLGVIAMILALGGTALAAGALTGKQKKEVEKIAKKYAGKDGAAGAAGAAGTNGTNGKDGVNGTNGSPGTPGKDGTNGVDGKSVTVEDATSFQCNSFGGAIVKEQGASSGIEVCNGEPGADGAPGQQGQQGVPGNPWAPENELPPGATETGAWAFTGSQADVGGIAVPISFTVKVANNGSLAGHYQTDANFTDFCEGSVQEPTAEPEALCVYYNTFFGLGAPVNATFDAISPLTVVGEPGSREEGVDETGAVLYFTYSGGPGENAQGLGSWAVSAEAP